MRFNFDPILEKLNDLNTNYEKYEYLLSQKAQLEREMVSVKTFDIIEFEKLKSRTEQEYERYIKAPYRIQANNHSSLARRLKIENKIMIFEGRIKIFEIEIDKYQKLIEAEINGSENRSKNLSSLRNPYFEYCYKGDFKESKYTLVLTKNVSSSGEIISPEDSILFDNLLKLLFRNNDPLFDEHACLSYHYNNCKAPKEDFIKYTFRMYLDKKSHSGIITTEIDKEVDGQILKWFKEKQNKFVPQENSFVSKLNFTIDKLRPTILELANLNGYSKPSIYLDELLFDVRKFNSLDFEGELFLNIHYLCKENSERFWSQSHKDDISQWLNKARIVTEVFKTTWDKIAPKVNQDLEKANYNDDTQGNDFLISTIEDYLNPFKDQNFSKSDYNNLVNALKKYFANGEFPEAMGKINLFGKLNKKVFARALYQIYRAQSTKHLPREYLMFAKNHISIFFDEKLDENNWRNSNLYKYFTSKLNNI